MDLRKIIVDRFGEEYADAPADVYAEAAADARDKLIELSGLKHPYTFEDLFAHYFAIRIN
jgi:hypothetical protein